MPTTAVPADNAVVLEPSCGTKSPIAPAPSACVVLIPCTVAAVNDVPLCVLNDKAKPLPGLVVLTQTSPAPGAAGALKCSS